MTSPPGSATAASSCWATPTDPQPRATWSAGTPKRWAIAVVSSSAPLSGYRLISSAASAMTLATDGSGPNGLSLDDSLNARPPTAWAVAPGLYPGMSSRMRRSRGAAVTRPVWHAASSAGSRLRTPKRPPGRLVQRLGRVRVGLGGQRGGHGGRRVRADDRDRADEVAGPVAHGPHGDAF